MQSIADPAGVADRLVEVDARIADAARGAGRDPSEITRAASLSLEDDADTIQRNVDVWAAAGFEYLICGWPAGGRAEIESFAANHLA